MAVNSKYHSMPMSKCPRGVQIGFGIIWIRASGTIFFYSHFVIHKRMKGHTALEQRQRK